jgi:type I restriction enzyme, S subunit
MSDATSLHPGWQSFSLADLSHSITSGATPESGNPRYYTSGGGHAFAKIEDLTRARGRELHDCEIQITDAALRETAAKLYPAGTILLSMYGTIGLAKVCARPLSANQALCALLPPFGCDPQYLLHHLEYRRAEWDRYSGQTTQANINGAIVRAHQVPIPPVADQVSIVAILNTIDTTILQTEAIIEKLKQVKQGLLHDLLTRGIDANGELRPPQSQAPHLYKDSLLGWMPKEWRCETVGRVIQGTPRNGLYKTAGDIGLGMLLVGQTAFTHEGSVDFGQARRARISNAEREAFGLNQDDVLVSRVFATREGVGQPVLVPELGEPAVYESNMMRLRANLQMIQPRLLFLWLKHRAARAWIMSRAFASNQASINRETICSVPTATPPIAEQRAILEVCRAHEHRIGHEMTGLEKLRTLKSGLMDDLLTGRIRVTPLLANATT